MNGTRFCPDTGHVTGQQLLQLARLEPAARERKIRLAMRLWLRPAQLRRRARVLVARTAMPAALNTLSLVLLAALSVYLVTDGASLVEAL